MIHPRLPGSPRFTTIPVLVALLILTAPLLHGQEIATSGDAPASTVVQASMVAPVDTVAPVLRTSFLDTLAGDAYPLPYDGYDPFHTRIHWGHAAIVTGGLTAIVGTIHFYQMNAWWKDQRGPFHFVEDNTYALNVDKGGHFFGGALASFVGKKSLEWSGVSRGSAGIWGPVLGALFELYVEFEDGFAQNWGFSPGDAYADVLGAAWIAGQECIPTMRHFQPKWSYFPSGRYLRGEHKGNAFDDYDGQTYWMGVHVWELLPTAWKSYWPSWLAIAVGVSVRGVGQEKQERSVILALDYDFTKIIPGDSWFMQSLKELLNFFHFPAPAIRISPDYLAYGLYFQ